MLKQLDLQQEPILTPEVSRFVILPIKYPELWELYKKHEAAFWKAEDIDYKADLGDWQSLSDDERTFIEYILAFFAGSDGIVLENLVSNFCSEVQISEARAFYSFQGMIENVHAFTYALLLDSYVQEPKKKDKLFNAIETIPTIKQKADFAIKWMSPEHEFSLRLVAFAVIEGVFFSGAFCSIFWLKDRNKMVRALGHANELIARDEGMHVNFACVLFGLLVRKPDAEQVYELMDEAVHLETEFICEAIPCAMIGMNSKTMTEYIQFVADRLLVQLGYPKRYMKECPYSFMDKIGLEGKTNFFEKRVSEYQLSSELNESISFSNPDNSDF